jgi:hypothetical protein
MNKRKFSEDAKRLRGMWGKEPIASLKVFEDLIAKLRTDLDGKQLLFLVLYKIWVCLYSGKNGGYPSIIYNTFHDDDKKLLEGIAGEKNVYVGLSTVSSFELTNPEWRLADEAIKMLKEKNRMTKRPSLIAKIFPKARYRI